MPDKLVIVESPAKAKTIGKILGKDYIIKASYGHIRDLPERAFGVDIEHDFAPQYEESKSRGKNLSELKKTAKSVKEIYLAPDPDREGEAIAWHLHEVLKNARENGKFKSLDGEMTAALSDNEKFLMLYKDVYTDDTNRPIQERLLTLFKEFDSTQETASGDDAAVSSEGTSAETESAVQ